MLVSRDGDRTTVKMEAPEGSAGVAGFSVGSVSVTGEGVAGANAAEDASAVTFEIVKTTTRIWVDQETFITLKMETRSDDGPLSSYEVTDFEANPDFDPSVFAYEAPEGVSVVEADTPEEIKIVLSDVGGSGTITGGHFESDGPVEEGTTEH